MLRRQTLLSLNGLAFGRHKTVLAVQEECVVYLKGWRSHKPIAASWLGRDSLLGSL